MDPDGITLGSTAKHLEEVVLFDIFWHEPVKAYSIFWDVRPEDDETMERVIFTLHMAEETIEMEPSERSIIGWRKDCLAAGHVFLGQGIIKQAITVMDIEQALHLGLGYVVTKHLPVGIF